MKPKAPTQTDIENQNLLLVPSQHHKAIKETLFAAISKAKRKEERESLIYAHSFFEAYTLAVEVKP